MTERFPCPYLNGEVELTDERRAHLVQQHPDLCRRMPPNLRRRSRIRIPLGPVATTMNAVSCGGLPKFTKASTSSPLSVRTSETMVQLGTG